MQRTLTYLRFLSLALLGACASTTQMEPDGQTHWMKQCDEESDCGALSCICGVCTEACTQADECSEGAAACAAASDVIDVRTCTLREAAASVCVPSCEAQSDCSSVARGLTCTSDDVCALDERAPVDGSVPDLPDTSVAETGPLTPIELACDDEGNLTGEGPFEVVVSGDFGGALAIAPSGTVFATGRIDDVYGSAFRVVDGEIDGFGMELWELQRIVVAGDELITGKSNGFEATVRATDVVTQEQLTLARQDALNLTELTADGEAVYWAAQLEQDPVRTAIWRSPRVPGESLLLAEMDGYVSDLVVLDAHLFFFGSVDGSYELIRIAKDGSTSAKEAIEVPDNAGSLRSDGQHIFFALHDGMDDLGNPIGGERGIVRMDPVTLDSTMVLSTGSDQPEQMIAGGDYVHWTTDHTTQDFEPILKLWRGTKDGGGSPVQLGTIAAYAGPFAEHDGQLFWISTCRIDSDGTTKSHIVKTTD